MKSLSCGLSFLLIAVLFFQFLAYSENQHPLTRSQSVLNTFQVLCTLEAFDFERLNARAEAMHMLLQEDKQAPSVQNTVMRSKSWLGFLKTGPFLLQVEEMSGAKGVSGSCAVVADVPDVDGFRTETVKDMHLKDLSPEIGHDNSRSYVWEKVYGQGTTLIIRDFKPTGRSGVMMKFLVKR